MNMPVIRNRASERLSAFLENVAFTCRNITWHREVPGTWVADDGRVQVAGLGWLALITCCVCSFT